MSTLNCILFGIAGKTDHMPRDWCTLCHILIAAGGGTNGRLIQFGDGERMETHSTTPRSRIGREITVVCHIEHEGYFSARKMRARAVDG